MTIHSDTPPPPSPGNDRVCDHNAMSAFPQEKHPHYTPGPGRWLVSLQWSVRHLVTPQWSVKPLAAQKWSVIGPMSLHYGRLGLMLLHKGRHICFKIYLYIHMIQYIKGKRVTNQDSM